MLLKASRTEELWSSAMALASRSVAGRTLKVVVLDMSNANSSKIEKKSVIVAAFDKGPLRCHFSGL